MEVEDVRREVDIMRTLPPHLDIVRLKNAFEDAEAAHIAMDLGGGGELFDRIVDDSRLEERAAAGYITTIIEGVQVIILLLYVYDYAIFGRVYI